jgi:outer membrane protein assembly factor BamB
MKNALSTGISTFCVFIFLCVCGFTLAADWPHWRGPDYNGVSQESDWNPEKIKEGAAPLWKTNIGAGFSTISVNEGKTYTFGNTGSKGIDESQHKDVVFCFDAVTGGQIWTYSYPEPLDPKYYEGGTSATPTVAENRVYTLSKTGDALCLDADTGKLIWETNILKETGAENTTWGLAGSPLIVDNMVVYNAGSQATALDKSTGKLLWSPGGKAGGYATAVPCELNGKKQLVNFGFDNVAGLETASGEIIWSYPWKTRHDVNAADPIITGDRVFISSGYGTGCALLKVENNKATKLWQNRNMRNKMNPSVLYQGHIYGVDEGGELRCLDLETGGIVWAQDGFGMGSLMVADGKLIVLGEKGNLVIAAASPEGFRQISGAQILSGSRCWSVPVLANGRIYARNAEGDMVCLDVTTGEESTSSASAAAGNTDQPDWPQWRGYNRDGISKETGLMKKWPEGGPEMLWSVGGLGKGYSTVSITDGLIYTTGMIDKRGVLFAFDMDGKLAWKRNYGPEWDRSYESSRSTPTVDEGNVYVISGKGSIACFEAAKGEPLWAKNVFQDYGGEYGNWGIAESPLIVDDKVIVTPGGKKASVVALDKKTGSVIWASESIDERSAYCSPMLVQRGGRKIIITMLESLIGIDADTGEILWKHKHGKKDINPITPVYSDSMVYATSGYDDGGVMVELNQDGSAIKLKWEDETLDSHHGGVVLVDGYIYGSSWRGNSNGNWVCLDWNSGKVMYDHSWIGKGCLTYADGMLYCYEEKEGTVGLVKAAPDKFEVISSFKVPMGSDHHWAHPVVCGGRLYIRHGDVLMAYDIKAK